MKALWHYSGYSAFSIGLLVEVYLALRSWKYTYIVLPSCIRKIQH